MFYVVYNITGTQVAPLTPARGSNFLNEFRAAPGSVKQMLGGGGGGEEGRGPSVEQFSACLCLAACAACSGKLTHRNSLQFSSQLTLNY